MRHFLILLSILLCSCTEQFKYISIEEFNGFSYNEFELIDVRTIEEFQSGYISSAINIDFFSPDFIDKIKEFDKIILNSKLEAKNLFNEARQKVLDDIDKKRSELEKNLEEEIEIAEKEIQNLNKSSAENIKKIATETSSGLIKQLIGEEINKENISSIVNDLTNNSKENRKNV